MADLAFPVLDPEADDTATELYQKLGVTARANVALIGNFTGGGDAGGGQEWDTDADAPVFDTDANAPVHDTDSN